MGLTLLIVVLYTSVGGFVSVVRTDVIQGLLMLLGSVVIFYFVTRAAGGVTSIATLSALPEKQFLFELNGGIPFAVLLGVSLSGSLKLLADPRQLSRFYALKDEAEVRRGKWIATIGLAIVLGCLFPVGIYAHLILTEVTDTDLIVPSLVNDASVFPLMGDGLSDRLDLGGGDVVDGQRAAGCRLNALQKHRGALQSLVPRAPVDPHRGHRVFDCRGATGAQPAGRHRRDHDFLGQSLRGLLFPRGGIWALLAARLGTRCALVNGSWRLCIDRLDCRGVAAGPS